MENIDTTPISEPQEHLGEFGDSAYRTIGLLAIFGLLGVGALFVLYVNVAGGGVVNVPPSVSLRTVEAAGKTPHSGGPNVSSARFMLQYMPIRDTVYTTDSIYLDVNLTRQQVTVHQRNGGPETFLISSGNPFLHEGITTPSGLFTVQNMTPMAISKQFNDAKLHHWIGIQGGVGFHGLDGNGYYGYLGKRPSSHGCIRMSREEIKRMYTMVHPGALIMVHDGSPARVVSFCDETDTAGACLIDSASVFDRSLGKARLRTLYEGNAWVQPQARIVHIARQRFRWGMEIGKAAHIPKQKVPDQKYQIGLARMIPIIQPDRTALASISSWSSFAARAVDSVSALNRKAWESEAEPDYGE